MKHILLFALLFAVGSISAQKIKWMSMNEAVAAQAKNPKKIFVDMYTNWCGPCKMLDRNTFSNKDVANYINANFYAVKFNAEGDESITANGQSFSNPSYDPTKAYRRNSQHQFAKYMGVRAYPTVLFIGEDGGLINRVKGYKTSQQMELYLKFFGTDLWKTINTQEAFNKYFDSFEPQFKS
ncbi:MAG: thioredoxin family protein [Flavobacteriaceae bacterium]|nr:thioredoxin family protein [Flavobacteriaceae bacterium]